MEREMNKKRRTISNKSIYLNGVQILSTILFFQEFTFVKNHNKCKGKDSIK